MTIQAHANAILALLAAAPPADPPLVVLDGFAPPGTTPPYVLVYFADTDPEESRPLTLASVRHVTRIYCHCVGRDAIAARAVAQRVRAALLDVKPTITDRIVFPIRHEDGSPPRRDEGTGDLVHDKVDVYRLESGLAPS